MKFRHEVSSQKLRGGYYTPQDLVEFCVERAQRVARRPLIEWLEPSAGDGAFVPAVIKTTGRSLTCVELDPGEAAKCRSVLDASGDGSVVQGSFFPWLVVRPRRTFDAVVGNPPYVRYQFLSDADRASAELLATDLGFKLQGVSNAWILFALVAMKRVRPGGSFSMVLPSELFATVSAGQFREALVTDYAALQIDMFSRGTFADLLQDVVVVSGRRAAKQASNRQVTFVEHRQGTPSCWRWVVDASPDAWMKYLLNAREFEAFEQARALPPMRSLGDVARLQVAVVTGANAYFTVPEKVVEQYDLHPWTVALLPKTAYSPGLRYTSNDFRVTRASGARSWLLDFGENRPKPNGKAKKYLAIGEGQGIPERYKCRIRSPWYRVPHIVAGALMLTKRAHQHHRLIENAAAVVTTDTVYRGQCINGYRSDDIVAGFHNSMTLLSAELEGRTYGGGVLELVPSEISRLVVPMIDGFGTHLDKLDSLSRATGGQKDESDQLADATDALLVKKVAALGPLIADLREARVRLRQRRFEGA